ncbi:MAG: acyltransferase family protein [Actinomycetes bacterium]
MQPEISGDSKAGLGYLPALDGIRALSIVLVMLYHGGVPGFDGGFFGVDIFFGLSGFLITSLLVEETHLHGRIDLPQFWRRRLKRLMPAIVVFLIGVNVISIFVQPAGLYRQLGADTASSLFFFANWHFIVSQLDYFQLFKLSSPLGHMWSLSIEEQFYWIWPPFLWFVLRRHVAIWKLVALTILIGVASQALVLFELAHQASTSRIYYGSDTHLQGLVWGAVAAFLFARVRRQGGTSARVARLLATLSPIALVVILMCAHTIGSNSSFLNHGAFVLVAICVSVILLHLSTSPTSMMARLFSWRPVVFVGQISFSLYLWHYPIFRFITRNTVHQAHYSLFAVRIVVTIIVATISFFVIERPLRRSRLPNRPWHYLLIGFLVTALAIGSLVLEHRQNAQPVFKPPRGAPTHQVTALLLGDSVAWTLMSKTSNWAPHYGVTLRSDAIKGCGLTSATYVFVFAMRWDSNLPCRTDSHGVNPLLERWRGDIAKYRPSVIVVLAGRWEAHDQFTTSDGLINITDVALQRKIQASMLALHKMAQTVGSQVVYLTSAYVNPAQDLFGSSYDHYNPLRTDRYNALISDYARTTGDKVFDINPIICPNGKFQWKVNGITVRSADGIHFSRGIAPVLSPVLYPYIASIATPH